MYSAYDIQALPWMGCPIRESPDHSLFSGSPKLNAASHALHRLSTPRHPPIALSSLTKKPLPWETPKDFSLLSIHLSKSKGLHLQSWKNYGNLPVSRHRYLLTAYGSLLTDLVEVNGFEPMTPCVQSRRSSV